VGRLVHRRYGSRPHRFAYPVFYHLLDLDELPEIERRVPLFGRNRARPVAFFDRDHLGDPARPVRENLEAFIRRQGGEPPGGRILLLTQPRIFGYVFNPVSFYYCCDREERLAFVVAEVNNTFGERHTYLLDDSRRMPAGRRGQGAARRRPGSRFHSYSAPKELYVSPFIGMETRFDFHFSEPGRGLSVHMDDIGPEGRILDATLSGRAVPLTTGNLLRLLLAQPFLTLQIIGRIHWQALRLWLKKVPHWTHVPRGVRETP
jgi:hypothetical protein